MSHNRVTLTVPRSLYADLLTYIHAGWTEPLDDVAANMLQGGGLPPGIRYLIDKGSNLLIIHSHPYDGAMGTIEHYQLGAS
jgi:hypothetical protein